LLEITENFAASTMRLDDSVSSEGASLDLLLRSGSGIFLGATGTEHGVASRTVLLAF